MARIVNPGREPLALATGHVVPAAGALETGNDVLRAPDNGPMLQGLALARLIALEFDPEPEPDPVSAPAPVMLVAPADTTPVEVTLVPLEPPSRARR